MKIDEHKTIKVLYCASTSSHLTNFHLPYIQWLSENGCEVATLTNDGQAVPFAANSDKAGFTKKLFSPQNVRGILEVKRKLTKSRYTIVVTNTTLAGAVVRAAVRLLPKQNRPKVLHICHGFLFNNKDGLKKWLYLMPERVCAKVTDVFAVMNRESEGIATRYKLGKQIVFTHGMGLDAARFSAAETAGGIFKFVYIAEFSARKNQSALIKAFAKAADKMPDARLVLAGDGAMLDECKQLAHDLCIAERADFPGYVADVPALLKSSDVAVSTSRYEGLPFNIMEAMASGMPVVASDIAGHSDLLERESLYQTEAELENMLIMQYNQGRRRVEYGKTSRYTLANVRSEWIEILKSIFTEK